MTFSLDPEVAAVLQAALEKNGPPPTPPAGDVQTRRTALDAMLDYFNNQAQPPAADVEVTDYEVTAADGSTTWTLATSGRNAVGPGAAPAISGRERLLASCNPGTQQPVRRY